MQKSRSARWGRVDLELSLKPFAVFWDDGVDDVAERVLRSWARLIDQSDAVATLLWVGEGSEVFAWSGDMSQRLEYAKYEGFCNLDAPSEPYFPNWYDNRPPVEITDNMPELTYGDLRDIIAALKRAAKRLFGLDLHAGIAFDPTPEFSVGLFKYYEHPEILSSHPEGRQRYAQRAVSHQGVFDADERPFASHPDGIPAGTTVGTFLGAQCASLSRDFGYDYLWMSNGFGYSHYAWSPNGEVLDTDGQWYPERAEEQLQLLNRFWRDFRATCPDLPVEMRGSNHPVGGDIGAHAVSHVDVLKVGKLDAMPPNIPVLRAEDLPRDVVAFLSRLAGAPGDRVIYRAYLNDPWHEHNPWHDIYNRQPFEPLTLMSCGRLRPDGSMLTSTDLHILTIDTERGEIPQQQVDEFTPVLTQALEERPDAAGPVVWVYPFDINDRILKESPERLPEVYGHDHTMWRAIEAGLPMGTVVTPEDLVAALDGGLKLKESVLLVPTHALDDATSTRLLEWVERGGRVLCIGPTAHTPAKVREAVGVELADDALDGDFGVTRALRLDDYTRAPDVSHPLRHHARTAGGGIRETADGDHVLVQLEQGGNQRVWATTQAHGSGRIAWVRGTVPYDSKIEPPYLRPVLDSPAKFQQPHAWIRAVLADLGVEVFFDRHDVSSEPPRLVIKRRGGAYHFVGSKPDTTTRSRIRLAVGAPVYMENDTIVRDGYSLDTWAKTIDSEVRFFVHGDGRYLSRTTSYHLGQSAGYSLDGCEGVDVTVYPDPEALRDGKVLVLRDLHGDKQPDGSPIDFVSHEIDHDHQCIRIKNHTGHLQIKW